MSAMRLEVQGARIAEVALEACTCQHRQLTIGVRLGAVVGRSPSSPGLSRCVVLFLLCLELECIQLELSQTTLRTRLYSYAHTHPDVLAASAVMVRCWSVDVAEVSQQVEP